MAKGTTKTVTIESIWGGLISQPILNFTTGPVASLEGGKDQFSYAVAITPTRTERLGHIAPSETFTALTDSNSYVVALGLNAAVVSSGNPYVVLKNSRVVKLANIFNGASSVSDYFIPVAHGGQTVSTTGSPDMIVVKDASAAASEYIVATWNDAAGGDVMIFKDNGVNLNSTWFSQDNSLNYLVAGVPLKLTQGPDGNIYGTNGQYVWSATMATGVGIGSAVRTAQALNVGPGYYTVGICNYKSFVAIGGHQSTVSSVQGLSRSNCRVWLWDGFSGDPNFIYDIPDNFLNGIYCDGNTLYAFTNGRTNSSRLWEFTGQQFKLIYESLAINTSSNFIQGSMDFWKGALHIAAKSKHIYSLYGKGLQDEMIVANGTTEDIGFFKNLSQGEVWTSMQTGSNTYAIYYLADFSGYYPGAEFRTRLFTNWDDGTPMRRSKINKVKLWFSQFGTGASLLISFFKGYTAIGVGGANDLMNKTLTNSSLGALTYYAFDVSVDDFESFYMNFRFNHASVSNTAAIIRKVVLEGEETDLY